jgi:hypothetical protein
MIVITFTVINESDQFNLYVVPLTLKYSQVHGCFILRNELVVKTNNNIVCTADTNMHHLENPFYINLIKKYKWSIGSMCVVLDIFCRRFIFMYQTEKWCPYNFSDGNIIKLIKIQILTVFTVSQQLEKSKWLIVDRVKNVTH